jgi:hypothetical protein
VHCFSVAIQIQRGDTKANVERKQGMTERERQQELEQLYSEQSAEGTKDEDEDSDGEGQIHNPLKLPLARSDSGSPGYNECSWHRSDSRPSLVRYTSHWCVLDHRWPGVGANPGMICARSILERILQRVVAWRESLSLWKMCRDIW